MVNVVVVVEDRSSDPVNGGDREGRGVSGTSVVSNLILCAVSKDVEEAVDVFQSRSST